MKTMEWSNASSANELLEQGRGEDVVVTRGGKPVAVVMPVDPDDVEFFVKENDPSFIESIATARADIGAGGGVDHEQLKKEFGV